MLLSVSKALKTPGEPFSFDESLCMEPQEFGGVDYAFIGPVRTTGTYTSVEQQIVLQGQIEAKLETQCARCLEPAVFQLTVPFEEKYLREPSEDEPDAFLYESSQIELDEMALGNLLMNLPIRVLCKEDCKGLCPQCGTNLNQRSCDCGKDLSHSPFAALSALRFDKE